MPWSGATPDRPSVYQDEERRQLQVVFAANVPPGGPRRVLDAGCGYKLPIDVPRGAHLTGIDVSEAALEKNANADELILGDLQTYPLPEREFDAVICWWVLEHVPDPQSALINMASSLQPGGLLVLGIPNVYSMKGLVTKFTPFRFHVWVLKHFYGIANAGTPGVEPYPTYLRMDLAPSRLHRIMAQCHLTPIYAVRHRSGDDQWLPPLLRSVWNWTARIARILTLGRWDPHLDEYVAIFRKDTHAA